MKKFTKLLPIEAKLMMYAADRNNIGPMLTPELIESGLEQLYIERFEALKNGNFNRLIEIGNAEKHLMSEHITLLKKGA